MKRTSFQQSLIKVALALSGVLFGCIAQIADGETCTVATEQCIKVIIGGEGQNQIQCITSKAGGYMVFRGAVNSGVFESHESKVLFNNYLTTPGRSVTVGCATPPLNNCNPNTGRISSSKQSCFPNGFIGNDYTVIDSFKLNPPASDKNQP